MHLPVAGAVLIVNVVPLGPAFLTRAISLQHGWEWTFVETEALLHRIAGGGGFRNGGLGRLFRGFGSLHWALLQIPHTEPSLVNERFTLFFRPGTGVHKRFRAALLLQILIKNVSGVNTVTATFLQVNITGARFIMRKTGPIDKALIMAHRSVAPTCNMPSTTAGILTLLTRLTSITVGKFAFPLHGTFFINLKASAVILAMIRTQSTMTPSRYVPSAASGILAILAAEAVLAVRKLTLQHGCRFLYR